MVPTHGMWSVKEAVVQWIRQLNRARVVRGEKVLLDDVTLLVLPAAKIGVVGPNGAGKWALLRVMAVAAATARRIDFDEIHIPPGPRRGSLVIEAEHLSKSFGDHELFGGRIRLPGL